MTQSGRTPEIAIRGGGIGGLAAAFLHRGGLRCTLYEQAAELEGGGRRPRGGPNAARLLRRLDVLDELGRRAVRLDAGWEFRRWQDGTILSAENLTPSCEQLYGEQTYTVDRADLLDLIRRAIPAGTVRLGKRCTDLIPAWRPHGAALRGR